MCCNCSGVKRGGNAELSALLSVPFPSPVGDALAWLFLFSNASGPKLLPVSFLEDMVAFSLPLSCWSCGFGVLSPGDANSSGANFGGSAGGKVGGLLISVPGAALDVLSGLEFPLESSLTPSAIGGALTSPETSLWLPSLLSSNGFSPLSSASFCIRFSASLISASPCAISS